VPAIFYTHANEATHPAIVKPRNAAAAPARQAPEYQLKHRVTGAAIIATAAALVIAWLLGQSSVETHKGGADSAQQTASSDPGLPAPAAAPQGPGAGAAAEPRAALVTERPDGADQAGQGKAASTPPTAETGWTVRVGAFSSQANVDSVTAKLTGAGFRVNATRVKTAQGKDATRIWLGPYASRQTAREVSERLQTSGVTGERGAVVRHTP